MTAGGDGGAAAGGKRCRNMREPGNDLCPYHRGMWLADEATAQLEAALREHVRAVTRIADNLRDSMEDTK